MTRFTETVEIRRPLAQVYRAITDCSRIEELSNHLRCVSPISAGEMRPGFQYRQVNLIHGRQYSETVVVEKMETNEKYATRRSQYGVDVAFRYSFEATGEGATLVTLVKEVSARGLGILLLPLTKHLMTAPEHDGNSLEYLRYTIEHEM